jgi:hypothetical protein
MRLGNYRVDHSAVPVRRIRQQMIAGIVMCLCIAGCRGNMVAPDPPEISNKIRTIKVLAILPPQIKMSEIAAGGYVEEMHEWNDQAERNFQSALVQEFKNRQGVTTMPLAASDSDLLEANVQETRMLMIAVESAMDQDSSNSTPINERYKQSVYSLGTEVHDIAPKADAILLLQGTERRSTAGRKAAQAGAALASVATYVLIGVALVPMVPGGTDPIVSATLIDSRDGRVLWHRRSLKGSDLRMAETTDEVMQELFNEFPLH